MEEELKKIKEDLKNKSVGYVILLWAIVLDELKIRMKLKK